VNCFHQGPNFLAIDPEKCIDCALCVYECPVKAIFEEEDVPAHWVEYIDLNSTLSQSWPVITSQKPPLPTAEEFRDVAVKRHLLDLNG
jgi:ferredoxin